MRRRFSPINIWLGKFVTNTDNMFHDIDGHLGRRIDKWCHDSWSVLIIVVAYLIVRAILGFVVGFYLASWIRFRKYDYSAFLHAINFRGHHDEFFSAAGFPLDVYIPYTPPYDSSGVEINWKETGF